MGGANNTKEARRHLAVTGRLVERARHLGNVIAVDGSTRGNPDKRIAVAKAGFQALCGIWGKRGIGTSFARELFKSMN